MSLGRGVHFNIRGLFLENEILKEMDSLRVADRGVFNNLCFSGLLQAAEKTAN